MTESSARKHFFVDIAAAPTIASAPTAPTATPTYRTYPATPTSTVIASVVASVTALFAAFFLAFFLAAPALQAQTTDQQIDPFYLRLLNDGRLFYQQGNYAGVVDNMGIAFFGFLDFPDKLLECYLYLEISYNHLKNEEKSKYYYDEIRRLKLLNNLKNLEIPDNVAAKFDEVNAAFAAIEARIAARIAAAAKPGATPPGKKTEPRPAAQTETSKVSAANKEKTTPLPPPASDKIALKTMEDILAKARAETSLSKKIKLYKQALLSDPSNIDIYFEMNDAYTAAKKYRDGAALMDLLLKYYPNDLRIHLRLAENTLADRSFEKAYKILVQASRISPNDIGLRYLVGKADMGLKRYKEAVAEFDYVLSIAPDYRDAASWRKFCADKIK